MKNSIFISAKEVAKALDISEAHGYKLVRTMNEELSKQGFLVIAGRVSKKYFYEKLYCYGEEDNMNVCI